MHRPSSRRDVVMQGHAPVPSRAIQKVFLLLLYSLWYNLQQHNGLRDWREKPWLIERKLQR